MSSEPLEPHEEGCVCCAPCRIFFNYLRTNPLKSFSKSNSSKKDSGKDPESILILETSLRKTVDLVIEYLSWSTAGILSIACSLTILITEWHNLIESWLNFFILVSIALLYGTYIVSMLVDDHEEVGNNLILQMTKGKIGEMTIAEYIEMQMDHTAQKVNRNIVKKRVTESYNVNDNNTKNSKNSNKKGIETEIDAAAATAATSTNSTNKEMEQEEEQQQQDGDITSNNNNNNLDIMEKEEKDHSEDVLSIEMGSDKSTNNGSPEKGVNDKNENEEDVSRGSVSNTRFSKFAVLTHIEVNILFKNMNTLAIATFANVIALTLRNVISESLSYAWNNKAGFEVITYWIVATITTILALVSTLKLTTFFINTEKETYHYIATHGVENSKSQIAKYASRRRMTRLICYIFGQCMAWSWNDAIKYSIYALFDDQTNAGTTTILWMHVIIVQLFVTFFNTFARQLRGWRKSHFGKFFNFNQIRQRSYKSKRWLVYAVFYKNLQMVTGFAWYEGVGGTIFAISGVSDAVTIILLWFQIIALVLLSVVLQYYWKKYWFGYEILTKGLLKAYYDACDYVTDKSGELDEMNQNNSGTVSVSLARIPSQEDKKSMIGSDGNELNHSDAIGSVALSPARTKPPSVRKQLSLREMLTPRYMGSYFWFIFWKEFVDLLIYAWTIAGGVSVYRALTFTFITIFYKSTAWSHIDAYATHTNAITVIFVWIAWFFSLFIAVLILTYLSGSVEKATEKRKQLFEKWKKTGKNEKHTADGDSATQNKNENTSNADAGNGLSLNMDDNENDNA